MMAGTFVYLLGDLKLCRRNAVHDVGRGEMKCEDAVEADGDFFR